MIEIIAPAKWSLVGSVTTPAHLLRTSNSLQIVHRFGVVSSGIRSAMLAKSILPIVEINTPNAKVILVNATIVNIAHYVPPAKSKGSHVEGGDTNELEEFQITFQKITVENLGAGTSAADNWTNVTGKPK
jgi:hypothetical protein